MNVVLIRRKFSEEINFEEDLNDKKKKIGLKD
jgi:hypothetical protein